VRTKTIALATVALSLLGPQIAWTELGSAQRSPSRGGTGTLPGSPSSIAWTELGSAQRSPSRGGTGTLPGSPSSIAWTELGSAQRSPSRGGTGTLPGSPSSIDALLDAWRFRDAATALAALQRAAPNAPETAYLSGYQKFLTGDYDGAVRALATAAQAAPSNPEIRSLAELAGAARDAVKDYREERSAHVIIRYAPEDAVLMPYARDTLEAAYAALHEDLGFEPELPIRVEFYRSPSDLAAVSSLSVAEVARTGTIALCKWARLMVTTPRALAYGYPWLDSINHELVHYAVSTLTGDRAPVWLQEGLAKFLERRWREPPGGRIAPPMEHLLAKALRANRLISFEAMHPSMAKLPSAEDATLAFAEVENAVAYLWSKGGMPALRDAIKRVAAGEDARQAVAAAAGGGWPEFERGWRAFMTAQHYRTFPAIDIPTTHVRKANAIASGRKPAEEDALSSTLRAGAPYRYLRLGNMLLGRERPRAAAAEYEKGAKAVGAGVRGDPSASWVFPVKLGRTYLALGEPDRALKALAPVRAVYPDLPWPSLIAGEAQLALGDAPGAVISLRASLATNPFDPRVHCALAAAYAKLPAAGRPAEALVTREQQFCKQLGAE
jgi:Flp pilus assembly protein TadD